MASDKKPHSREVEQQALALAAVLNQRQADLGLSSPDLAHMLGHGSVKNPSARISQLRRMSPDLPTLSTLLRWANALGYTIVAVPIQETTPHVRDSDQP